MATIESGDELREAFEEEIAELSRRWDALKPEIKRAERRGDLKPDGWRNLKPTSGICAPLFLSLELSLAKSADDFEMLTYEIDETKKELQAFMKRSDVAPILADTQLGEELTDDA